MTRWRRRLGVAVAILWSTVTAQGTPPSLPIPSTTPVSNLTFVAFDTETTGLKADEARLVEIAAVKFRAGDVLERRVWLVNPGSPIPAEASRIHGITDAMVSNSPPFPAVLPSFEAFTTGCVLLAHNAGFDRRFVAAELKRGGLAAPAAPLLDTMPLFKAWFPGRRSFALESLVSEFLSGITQAQPPVNGDSRTNRFHTAGGDAECLRALFLEGSKRLPAGATLDDLLRLTGGAYTFGAPRRQWRPTPQAHSSSDAAPDELAP